MWVLLAKPLIAIVFFGMIVAPLTWLAWKAIPAGRLRDILFEVRAGPTASRRDKAVVFAVVIGFYAMIGGMVVWSTHW